MARRRMIDPAMWTDEKFGSLTLQSKLMFIGLVSNADDEGRGNSSSNYLKAVLLPYDEKISPKSIEASCKEIAEKMNIIFYQDAETKKQYYQILKFNDWQTINRPTPSKIPKYDEQGFIGQFNECSMSIHTPLTLKLKEVKLKEVNISKDNICRFANTDLFEILWKEYPKRAGSSKQKALTSFEKLKCDDVLLDKILKSITILKDSKAWLDGYVPHLATFLNQKRWESVIDDEPKAIVGEQVDIEALVNEYEQSRGANK
ncbi:MAG: hypothetical protein M0R51_18235 [Clostridia bacterium]|jgi:hypothetical protein|nr:hypothetical protein [Clostridia bacterium]